MQLSKFKGLITNMPVSYQAFTSKRSTCKTHITGNNRAGEALSSIFGKDNQVTLSRSDLKSMTKHQDLAQFVIATIIWGYPRGMRGNHVPKLINDFEPLIELLSGTHGKPV